MQDPNDDLDDVCPAFLRRPLPDKPNLVKELPPVKTQTVETTKATPNAVKAKATAKAAKPAVKAKAKPASKPVEAKPAQTKATAKKPTSGPRKANAEPDTYGFKAGTIKSKAASLYARKNGATVEEVKASTGSLQLNLLKTLTKNGWKVKRVKEKAAG